MRLQWIFIFGLAALPLRPARAAERLPNIVIILADDLGYGDLGCYGHPTIRTPHLDRMAAEGMRFTQFYSAAPVCTPSRAALMTGRLPIRTGLYGDRRRVLYPASGGGIPEEELTIAELLKSRGYATACVGKWHLGSRPEYLPTRHGFDSYYGIPYSNDMKPCPLLRNEEVLEEPVDQTTLTRRYTEEAVKFVRDKKDGPFFLYFAQTFPHVPLFVSERFRGTSYRGLYGDVVEELDWSVGQVLNTLRELNIDRQTLVVFSSDNGPWLIKGLRGGSAGLLRDGKGSTWEGGMRVPTLAWWPGTIAAGGIQHETGSLMDLFPTCSDLVGEPPPGDRPLDGRSLLGVLRGQSRRDPAAFFYYDGSTLLAVRKGRWKMHWMTRDGYGPGRNTPSTHNPPILFNLDIDPGEVHNVVREHPDVLADLMAELERHRATLEPAASVIDADVPNTRPAH